MATKPQKNILGEVGDILENAVGSLFPESAPDFPARAEKALAEQAAKEALQALADSNSMPVASLALVTAAKVLSIQGGSVIGNSKKDLAIIFNPPVKNPTFIITNLWNTQGSTSDIGYDPTTLTPNGVTVKRGYGMAVNGLQDFSWVALSVTNPTVTPPSPRGLQSSQLNTPTAKR